ncbi:MAG TPA: DVUA0089 family protein [Casimicrobiaceae bacterium]|nr:DVUA0089 family protein [Casimicrobiaceae bacterium]
MPVTLSGFLNDPSNPALVAWDLTAPGFADDNEIANNVALYQITVGIDEDVTFTSTGFALGGIAPYFTLFAGSDNSATFVDSNYNDAVLGDGGDFQMTEHLTAGVYTVAIGAFENISFAENLGSGTLGDGFIGLGDPSQLGDQREYYYELTVAAAGTPLPEPATGALFGVAALALALARLRAPRSTRRA